MGHFVVRACAALSVCAPVSLASSGAAGLGRIEPGVVESLWLTAESGLFLDPARWSGGAAPNNTTETEYDAVINAQGAAYTVTLEGGDVALRSLTIESLGVTMRHLSGTLDVSGMIDIKQGVYELGNATIKNATIRQSGGVFRVATTSNTMATLENVTLEGGVFDFSQSNTRIAVRGDLTLDGASIEIRSSGKRLVLDEAHEIRGGAIRFIGSGDWTMTTALGQTLTIAADASMNWRGSGQWNGGGATVINQGLLLADHPASGSTLANVRSLGMLQNDGLVQAINFSEITFDIDAWSNSGRIEASGRGQIHLLGDGTNTGVIEAFGQSTITVGSTALTNMGEIVAYENSLLTLGGAWTNLGVIRSEGGQIRLDGQFTTSQMETVDAQAYGVEIIGSMDNTGRTLTLTSETTPLTVRGGTVTGGEILNAHDGALVFGRFGNSTLRELSWRGDMHVPASISVSLQNVSISDGSIAVDGGGVLSIDAATSLSGEIVLNGGALWAAEPGVVLDNVSIRLESGVNALGQARDGRIQATSNGLVIGPNADITGSAGIVGISSESGTIINYGRIHASALPDEILIGTRMHNYGAIEARNGGRIYLIPGTGDFQNHGTVLAGAGGTILLTGSFSSADFLALGITREISGDIAIQGSMSITNNVFVIDGTTGDLSLGPGNSPANASIRGGEVHFKDGNRLVGRGGDLIDISIHAGGDFVLDRTNEHFRFRSGVSIAGGDLVLSASGATAEFRGGMTWDEYDIVAAPVGGATGRLLRLVGSPTPGGAPAFILPEGRTIHGGNITIDGFLSHLVNYGVIRNDWEGSAMSIAGLPSFTNHNLLLAENGARVTLSPSLWTNHGLAEAVEGSGLAVGAASWSNLGEIRASGGSTLHLLTMPDTFGDIRIIDSTLKLDAFSTAILSEFQFQGDNRLAVSGVWQNTGSHFSLAGSSLALVLESGTIQGGSIDLAGSDLTTRTGGTLQNVALSGGDVVLDAAGTLRHSGTVSLAGGSVRLLATGANLSVVSGVATIDYDLSLEAPDGGFSAINLLASSQSTITAGSVISGGSASFLGNQARLTNHGVISADRQGASITVVTIGGQFTNHGVVEARNGGTFQGILTNFTNIAGGALTGGTWRVFDGSEIDLSEYTITRNAANVELHGADSRFAAINGLRENAGRLALMDGRVFEAFATGRADDVFLNTGELVLGLGGELLVTRDYQAGADAIHTVYLGGAAASGLLGVSGVASLDGELRILLGAGFAPGLGDSWTIVSAAQVVGGFSSFTTPTLGGGLSLSLAIDGGAVTLTTIPAPGTVGTLGLMLLVAGRRRRAA